MEAKKYKIRWIVNAIRLGKRSKRIMRVLSILAQVKVYLIYSNPLEEKKVE